jgi:multicomponent Na+:H+ antiporter subunit D
MSNLPALVVAVPLIVAALIAALRYHAPRMVWWGASLLTALFCLAANLWLMWASRGGAIMYWFGGWRPRPHGIAVGIAFAADPIGAGAGALAAALVLAAFVFSWRYFDDVRSLFYVLMLGFLAAMCGFSLTGDLFNLFVFFELMSAVAFALCSYKIEEAGPLQGGLNFAVTNTLGAFLILSGIGLVYARTGALNMAQAGRALGGRADGLAVVAFAFIMAGFFVKAAVVPFHFWLADAHAVAPTPVCVLFSGIMVELGVYAVARVYWTVFAGALQPHADFIRPVIAGAGALTAIVGAVMCFAQRHIKRLLAFSTISHVGLLVIGLGLLDAHALAGAAIYVLGHGFVKAALFLCAGIVLHRLGSVDEVELHGRARTLRVTAIVWIASGFGLASFPPFATSLGDDGISEAAKRLGFGWVGIVSLLASALTAAAVFRSGLGIFWGWGAPPERHRAGHGAEREKTSEGQETEGGHQHTPLVMKAAAVCCALAAVGIGLIPHLDRRVLNPSASFVNQHAYAARVLGEATPDLAPSTASDAFVYRPVQQDWPHILTTTIAAWLIALFALYYRRRRVTDAIGGFAARLVAPLRAIHSGRVGDYVAWLVAGVAVFGAVLLRMAMK